MLLPYLARGFREMLPVLLLLMASFAHCSRSLRKVRDRNMARHVHDFGIDIIVEARKRSFGRGHRDGTLLDKLLGQSRRLARLLVDSGYFAHFDGC